MANTQRNPSLAAPYLTISARDFMDSFTSSLASYAVRSPAFQTVIQQCTKTSLLTLENKIHDTFKEVMIACAGKKWFTPDTVNIGHICFSNADKLQKSLSELGSHFHCNTKLDGCVLPRSTSFTMLPPFKHDCEIESEQWYLSPKCPLTFTFKESVHSFLETLDEVTPSMSLGLNHSEDGIFGDLGLLNTTWTNPSPALDKQNRSALPPSTPSTAERQRETLHKVDNATVKKEETSVTETSSTEPQLLQKEKKKKGKKVSKSPAEDKKTAIKGKQKKRKAATKEVPFAEDADYETLLGMNFSECDSKSDSDESWEEPSTKKKKKTSKSVSAANRVKEYESKCTEDIVQIGIRAKCCDAATLLQYLDSHVADYVRDGIELFTKNSVKMINNFKGMWAFCLTLQKCLERIPHKRHPETDDIQVLCWGCPLHCVEHMEIPIAPGRPPNDPLLSLKLNSECQRLLNATEPPGLEQPFFLSKQQQSKRL